MMPSHVPIVVLTTSDSWNFLAHKPQENQRFVLIDSHMQDYKPVQKRKRVHRPGTQDSCQSVKLLVTKG